MKMILKREAVDLFLNRKSFLKAGLLGLMGLSGCNVNMPGPGGRLGCIPPPTPITRYLGEDAAKEQRGIAYTCKAGDIDIAHVRKYAEWTESFAEKLEGGLKNQKTKFSFSGQEPGKYGLEIAYSTDFNNLKKDEKEKIIKDVSIEIGQNLAYTMSLWHETLTWFGWKYTGIIPEFNSAFCWEDRFSDTFGCYIGGLALKQRGNFEKNLNQILEKELSRLMVQSKTVNKASIQNINGEWFSGTGFSSKIFVRNLDTGLEDREVSPLIPPVPECVEVEYWNCPVPNLVQSEKYGFRVEISIIPSGEAGDKILKVAEKNDVISVRNDFPKIMGYIEKDAIQKGYRTIH